MRKYRTTMSSEPAQVTPNPAQSAWDKACDTLFDNDDDDASEDDAALNMPSIEAERALYNAEAQDKTLQTSVDFRRPEMFWNGQRKGFVSAGFQATF